MLWWSSPTRGWIKGGNMTELMKKSKIYIIGQHNRIQISNHVHNCGHLSNCNNHNWSWGRLVQWKNTRFVKYSSSGDRGSRHAIRLSFQTRFISHISHLGLAEFSTYRTMLQSRNLNKIEKAVATHSTVWRGT